MHSRTLKLVIERGFRSEGHTDTFAKGPAQTRTTCGQLSPGLTEPTGWSGQGLPLGSNLSSPSNRFQFWQIAVDSSAQSSPLYNGVCVCVCVCVCGYKCIFLGVVWRIP